nr:uncharacterized protein LOC123764371 isoform X1 [Procambarus clarkii]XP_045608028.1 uncharacterized protein LOC123764371 isoform X1 [Procambarus clarkii]XP_045608029.1 uncharacterized protein LOC123764371 isoform X1 [Procambarus clarkii]
MLACVWRSGKCRGAGCQVLHLAAFLLVAPMLTVTCDIMFTKAGACRPKNLSTYCLPFYNYGTAIKLTKRLVARMPTVVELPPPSGQPSWSLVMEVQNASSGEKIADLSLTNNRSLQETCIKCFPNTSRLFNTKRFMLSLLDDNLAVLHDTLNVFPLNLLLHNGNSVNESAELKIISIDRPDHKWYIKGKQIFRMQKHTRLLLQPWAAEDTQKGNRTVYISYSHPPCLNQPQKANVTLDIAFGYHENYPLKLVMKKDKGTFTMTAKVGEIKTLGNSSFQQDGRYNCWGSDTWVVVSGCVVVKDDYTATTDHFFDSIDPLVIALETEICLLLLVLVTLFIEVRLYIFLMKKYNPQSSKHSESKMRKRTSTLPHPYTSPPAKDAT